jgi:hypothetical protein
MYGKFTAMDAIKSPLLASDWEERERQKSLLDLTPQLFHSVRLPISKTHHALQLAAICRFTLMFPDAPWF